MTGAMFGTWQGFMAASHLPSKSHNKQSAAPVVIVAEPKRSPEYDVAPVAISKADGEPLAKPAEDAPAFKTKSIGREKVAVAGRKKTTSTAHDLKSADDLKKISGVGPKMMQMLQGMGVTGFADIAAWTQEDAKRIDAELGLNGRILRDDWIGQAKNLLGQA
ncbi:hypothetical protein [Allorhizobium sonneratiae]|uniref:hypothetical protein n=1 Tax=Allorhizobium sonneratiae TaxID=2934936 RepID=UPI0020332433|nr:hypothetical protein [Allorhizobium sonneratiae]